VDDEEKPAGADASVPRRRVLKADEAKARRGAFVSRYKHEQEQLMHEPSRPPSEPLCSPEERDHIIKRRAQLQHALIEALVKRDTDPQQFDAQTATLVAAYGAAEVERMMGRVERQFRRPRDAEAEEAWLYNEYLQLYRRFGGTRRLLTADELAAFRLERARFLVRRDFLGETLTTAEERRSAEIVDLTLSDADLWDDLLPEDPPPSQRLSPPARKPGRNEPCWCGSGRKYKHCHLSSDEGRIR
jgi:hypothetical protein